MIRIKRRVGAALGLVILVGCGSSPGTTSGPNHEKYAAAIRRVIAEDSAAAKILKQKSVISSSEDVRRVVDAMQRIDLHGCPTEFQQAYLRHRNAWSEFAQFVAQYDGVAGFIKGFGEGFSGSKDGDEEEKRVRNHIRDTWLDVEMIALQYEVQPGREASSDLAARNP